MPKEEIPRGQLSCVILSTLLEQDKYGYEIIDEVLQNSQGKISIKQPSLYSSLKRMEEQSLISSYWRDSDIGGRRHYYHLTDLGKKHLEKWKNDYDDIYKVAPPSYDAISILANSTTKETEHSTVIDQANSNDFHDISTMESKQTTNDETIIPSHDQGVFLPRQEILQPTANLEQDKEDATDLIEEKQDDGVFITERLNPEDFPKPARWDARKIEVYVAGNSVAPDLKRSKQISYEDRVKDLYEKSKANAENQELEFIDDVGKFSSYSDLQKFYSEQNIKLKPYQKLLKKTERDYNMVRITKLNMLTSLSVLCFVCVISLVFGILFSFSSIALLNNPLTFIVFPIIATLLFIYSLSLYLRAPQKRIALDLTKFKINYKLLFVSLLIIPIIIAVNIICGFSFDAFPKYAITITYPSVIALTYFVYFISQQIILKTNSVY